MQKLMLTWDKSLIYIIILTFPLTNTCPEVYQFQYRIISFSSWIEFSNKPRYC